MNDSQRAVFHAFGLVARFALIASLKMRLLKDFFRTEVVFEDKNFQFLSSKTTSVR